MRIVLIAAASALSISVAGCYKNDNYNNETAYNAQGENYSAANADYDANASGNQYASTAGSWPEGARIVVENGTTYRIDPGGARIALGPNDARIEVIDGVRYRIDPGGARVRIDDQGVAVSVDSNGVTATVPANTTNSQ